jgi:hypothetical protein
MSAVAHTHSSISLIMTKHFLSLEIRTLASPPLELESLELESMPTIKIMQDANNHYLLATGIETIKSAIIDSIPHLGTNFRYPLMFQVQIIPGDRLDAFMASSAENFPPGSRQRISKQN